MRQIVFTLLTFVFSSTLAVLIHRYFHLRPVGGATFLMIIVVVFITGFVYEKSKEENENDKILTERDLKKFEIIFSKVDFDREGIAELVVKYGKKNESDFIIGIRSKENESVDFERIKNEIRKTYYNGIVISIVNMNFLEYDKNNPLAGGTRIEKEKS